jgi:adenosylcobinamide-GDP ribazoletransferase
VLPTDLTAAFSLLTRLPVPRTPGQPDFARCVWAFPVVGLAVGGLGGFVYFLTSLAGMPSLVASGWTLAATMFASGALHEDGLADTADGFGGGATPARKLEIMRDSRIGGYGALALAVSTLIRAGAVASFGRPQSAAVALIAAGMLGRGAMIAPLLMLGPARADGLGIAVVKPPAWSAMTGIGLALLAAVTILPLYSAVLAIAFAAVTSIALAILARRQIGGYTGDVLGATELATECVVLSALAATLF